MALPTGSRRTTPIVKAFGTPDVAELTHDPNFNWWDNYPAMPEPYDTWSDGISYGPEGFKPAHNKAWAPRKGGTINEPAVSASAHRQRRRQPGGGERQGPAHLLPRPADATGEWANIWAMNDDSSWAHAFGRMRGKDQIWYGSVTQYDQMAMENWLEMFRKYPEVGGKDPRPLMEASVHTLVTDVIEVAADGKSARGSFITPGVDPLPPDS